MPGVEHNATRHHSTPRRNPVSCAPSKRHGLGNFQYGFWDLSYSQRLSFPVTSMLPSYRLEFPKDERKLHVWLHTKTSFA
jgi:hypothetical protein